ncbi:MAG: T9SS type A sorting domain-containing protein [Candidatus Krumholzibacteria bacterium]|nr:T9SS type A sorting domain-containing protein [Candidatus Krumholzibacteria bacterium]
MKKLRLFLMILIAALSLNGVTSVFGTETLFDHRHTDLFLDISLVHAARDSVRVLFVRLSHGRQISVGLTRIEDEDFSVCLGFDFLCDEPGALCLYNAETIPYSFWPEGGADSIRAVLAAEPKINLVLFCWCDHLNSYTLDEVDQYLVDMGSLESEYPWITFVYATGTAESQDGYGFNRYICNLKIRNYCLINGKLLYDFADIESWYGGERATYIYNDVEVPYLHPDLYGNDAEHASFLNCEYKAMAFWHLIVNSVFDLGIEEEDPENETPEPGFWATAYPNPFNPRTTIAFSFVRDSRVYLRIYDVAGRFVRSMVDEWREAGSYEEYWDGLDDSGRPVSSGVYLYRLTCGKRSVMKKLVLLR